MSVASASVSAIAHPRRFIKPSTRAPRDGFISPRWSRLIVTRLHRLSDYFQNPARFMRALRWSSWDSSRPVCSRRCFDVVTCFYFLSSFRCQLSILRGMSRFFRNSFFRWKKKRIAYQKIPFVEPLGILWTFSFKSILFLWLYLKGQGFFLRFFDAGVSLYYILVHHSWIRFQLAILDAHCSVSSEIIIFVVVVVVSVAVDKIKFSVMQQSTG